MPEMPTSILTGIVIVVCVWLIVAVATVWLFLTSSERRERIRKKMLRYYFRGLPERSDDPQEERARRKSFLTQVGAHLLGDILMLAVLIPVGWFVIGGSEGDVAGLAVVFVVAPLIALHPYVIILTYLLTRRAESLE